MKRRSETGFALVELLVAIVVLAGGLLTLAGGALYVTRDLYRSKQATLSAAQSYTYMDWLRNLAASTKPPCTSAGFASGAVTWNYVTHSWSVTGSGPLRTVTLISTYPLAAGRPARRDTLVGIVSC